MDFNGFKINNFLFLFYFTKKTNKNNSHSHFYVFVLLNEIVHSHSFDSDIYIIL